MAKGCDLKNADKKEAVVGPITPFIKERTHPINSGTSTDPAMLMVRPMAKEYTTVS